MMRRRKFITLLGGAAATWPLAVRAQQAEQMRRVGVLMPAAADDPQFQKRIAAFRHALAMLGWTDGGKLHVETRWATTSAGEIRRNAAELAALAPDVILAYGASTVGALLEATHTVPIVFPGVVDPVGAGLSIRTGVGGMSMTLHILRVSGLAAAFRQDRWGCA